MHTRQAHSRARYNQRGMALRRLFSLKNPKNKSARFCPCCDPKITHPPPWTKQPMKGNVKKKTADEARVPLGKKGDTGFAIGILSRCN